MRAVFLTLSAAIFGPVLPAEEIERVDVFVSGQDGYFAYRDTSIAKCQD
jgi:hypothetical protein